MGCNSDSLYLRPQTAEWQGEGKGLGSRMEPRFLDGHISGCSANMRPANVLISKTSLNTLVDSSRGHSRLYGYLARS